MFKYLFIALVTIYVYTIAYHFFRLKEINSIIDTIEKYLSSIKMKAYGSPELLDDYAACLNKLLFRYPKIVKLLGFYCPDLEYGAPTQETYRNAVRIYHDILMKRNYVISDFWESFNPIVAVKKFLQIPSTFLNWIGFNLKSSSIKFINLIGWLLAYMLNLYADEIKLLITSFFDK